MFSTIAYILGLVVAVTIFLNLLSAKESLKKKEKKEKKDPEILDAKKVFQMKSDRPRPRICPVCGTLLNQDEYLLASIEPEKEGQKRQAHIYGCKYCFTTDGVNLQLSKMEP
ncbi:MAG: hypothetical protein OEZ34_15740 [Spirochaetia bacterium]|nr:hypothetical protein [Spirochaetia bacterium]